MSQDKQPSPRDREILDFLGSKLFPDQATVDRQSREMERRVLSTEDFVSKMVDLWPDLSSENRKTVMSYSHYNPNVSMDENVGFYKSEGEWVAHEKDRLNLMAEFLQFPDKFKPSKQALKGVYSDFISELLHGRRKYLIEVTDEDLNFANYHHLFRNVAVTVSYKPVTRSNFGGCVMTLSAEINRPKIMALRASSARLMNRDAIKVIEGVKGEELTEYQDGGIAFNLSEWIDRV